jgi:integral membrane protein (TIGR01906 family)
LKNTSSPSPLLPKILSWVGTFLIPVVLVLTAIRILFNPVYLQIEYNMPGFPVDSYGFTTQDRIYWAQYAMDYLLNSSGIEYIGDLKFADGSPLYNERELSHMVDVKAAIQTALNLWLASLFGLAALAVWARLGKWWRYYLVGLRRGGWLTVILVGSMIFFSLISFGVFFVAFHNVFFEAGTWQFFWNDTLIRLFPQRFWQDIFIYVGGMATLAGLALGIGLRKVDPSQAAE